MPRPKSKDRKRRKLRQLIEELRALIVLARMYNREQRRLYETYVAGVDVLSTSELDDLITTLGQQVRDLHTSLGATQPPAFYVEYLVGVELRDDHFLYLAKWQLKKMFRKLDSVWQNLELLPEHTLMSIDFHGLLEPGRPGELRILEAALFEDMCALFNRAWDLGPAARVRDSPKPILKEAAALRRASMLAAFYLVEAYLNSLAFDYLVAHGGDAPSADLDKIAEWDHKAGKQRLVNFRDKLLGYPRIILGLKHPPLQENNSPEVRFLLEEAKEFRDAIVHVNPRPEPFSITSKKELRFWRVGSATPITYASGSEKAVHVKDADEDWLKTIDTVVVLIGKIETLVHGHSRRLFWLQPRAADGKFHTSVFD